METETMAVNKIKFDFMSPEADIFEDNGFTLNPYNVRDWNHYNVAYNAGKGFQAVDLGGRVSYADQLLQSLLYQQEDGNYLIHVSNPIISTTKAIGQEVTGEQTYVVTSGNSRLVLLANLHACYHGLTDPGFTVQFSKFNHDIDTSLTVDSLYIDQIRDNTSVAVKVAQQYELISIVLDNLANSGVAATAAVDKAAKQFGVSNQVCYVAKRFTGFPDWFRSKVDSVFIANAEMLDRINTLYRKAGKVLEGLTLEKLWEDLEGMASDSRKPITASTLKAWEKLNLPQAEPETPEDTYSDIEAVEGSEADEVFGPDESGETAFDWNNSSDQEIYDYLQPFLVEIVCEADEETGEPFELNCPSVLYDCLKDEAYSAKRLVKAGKLLIKYCAMAKAVDTILTDKEVQDQIDAVAAAKAQAEIDAISAEASAELVTV